MVHDLAHKQASHTKSKSLHDSYILPCERGTEMTRKKRKKALAVTSHHDVLIHHQPIDPLSSAADPVGQRPLGGLVMVLQPR